MIYADPRLPLTFWRHVDPDVDPGHWLWTGAVSANGRGSCWIRTGDMQQPRWYQPHVAVFVYGGGILTPERPVVRHQCDMPLCCRWECLLAGSHAENAQDRVERGRHRFAPRLDPGTVEAVLDRVVELGAGHVTSQVAREFSLDRRTVQRIRAGVTHNPNNERERV